MTIEDLKKEKRFMLNASTKNIFEWEPSKGSERRPYFFLVDYRNDDKVELLFYRKEADHFHLIGAIEGVPKDFMLLSVKEISSNRMLPGLYPLNNELNSWIARGANFAW